MNREEIPSAKIEYFLGTERFNYFKNVGALESIAGIKHARFIMSCFQKELYQNALLVSGIEINDKEIYMERVKKTFFIQQTIDLTENVQHNITNLTHIMKKQHNLYSFLKDVSEYNHVVETYTNNTIKVSSTTTASSNAISTFCELFQDVELPPSQLIETNLTEEQLVILKTLQQLAQTILIFYIRRPSDYLVYGSYSLHMIREEIHYNDIDIYSSDPAMISNILSFLALWIYDIPINIHRNPLIVYYVAVEFKRAHIFDILYLHRDIQDQYKEVVKGVSILKTSIQFFNFFRSLTDFHRMIVFQKDRANTELKLLTLARDIGKKYGIKLVDKKPSSIIKRQMSSLLFRQNPDTDYLIIPTSILPFKVPFTHIFIYVTHPMLIAEALPDDSIFYRRHSGVYNEVVALVPSSPKIIKRLILKSYGTLNNSEIIPMGSIVETIDLGQEFLDITSKSSVLVISNAYSKLFIDKATQTLEPISFLNIFASIGLSLFLNEMINKKHETLFMMRLFDYVNNFTIKNTVEKLQSDNLLITSKIKTNEPHKNYMPAINMASSFSLFFEVYQDKTKKTFSKSEYIQHLA